MRVLFVAYYFEPFSGVGAKRISYWANQISKSYQNIELEVVTATPGNNTTNYKVHFVEDVKNSLYGRFFKSDVGASWSVGLKKWLTKNNNYDIILFTCGPFIHLRLVPWIKRKYSNTKVVIDFRDPMATNPRSNFKTFTLKLKNSLIKYLERKFTSKADHIISVNKVCLSLISGYEKISHSIIDNGYDEEELSLIKQDDRLYENIKVVYAGSFFRDRDPCFYLNYLKEFNTGKLESEQIHFVHVGPKSDFLNAYRKFNWVTEHGKKTYRETLEIISGCDFGLIFTLGHPFESTTKIFDYIALQKKILIFANSIPQEGPLIEYGELYKRITWIQNNKDCISNLNVEHLKDIISGIDSNIEQFSRKAGLRKLISLLTKLK